MTATFLEGVAATGFGVGAAALEGCDEVGLLDGFGDLRSSHIVN
jgi:hypothetical protein